MAVENTFIPTLGVTALARIIGRSEDTVRDLERRGVIEAVRDSANRRQFTAEQAERALAHYRKAAAA
jgi:DNA-binding transcriptional MerR regulator